MLSSLRLTCASAAILAMSAVPAFPQGVQSRILQGTAHDAADLVLPGVTVTVTSPALQRPRTAVTDSNGAYVLRGLPPGTYQITFELQGFGIAKEEATIELGRTTAVNVRLQPERVTEKVTVTAETPSALATPSGGMNVTYEEVDALPVRAEQRRRTRSRAGWRAQHAQCRTAADVRSFCLRQRVSA